ncbi:hypothetical protein LT706_17985 [Pseudomonas syringae pv. syringae]|uniref:hypothetical protein n=1 Tax=Pseudomonas syringae TaxID=317 RepID=UPI0006B979CA|nr:hypothetical protein [Pseudomonas syringae]KPB26151.1 Uncharacterized protein AC517_4770 [Pseudomonas syringae pv. syringae]MCK9713404.1 hypothetical protein [Pseudomonas syringae pv. syringae]MCK9717662.1 hypothetical protein [Pseudomonas syringae pv. syringae]MCK9763082.1 hypothetical protein [Pseudomonas syringae pv. syringae]
MEQFLLLMLVVLAPPFFGVGLVALVMGKGEWKNSRWRSILTLHPENGLVHQGLLWVSIVIPFLYFLILGIAAWHEFSISIDAEGFKKFIEISVLPLATLSISLPLAGLVSKLHSTQQTAVQIAVVSRKNNFDAFYSHRKELFSYFAQIGTVTYLDCLVAEYKIHPNIHQAFFSGDPKNGIPEPREQAFESVRSDFDFILMLLSTVVARNDEKAFHYYLNACNSILSVAKRLGVAEVSIGMVEKGASFSVQYDDTGLTPVATVGKTTVEILASVRYLRNFFNNLCTFASSKPHDAAEQYRHLLYGGSELLSRKTLTIESIQATEIQKILNNESFKRFLDRES